MDGGVGISITLQLKEKIIIISLLAMTRLKWEIYFKPFSTSPMKPGLATLYGFYSAYFVLI